MSDQLDKEIWIQEVETRLANWVGQPENQEQAKNIREWAESMYQYFVVEDDCGWSPEDAISEEMDASR